MSTQHDPFGAPAEPAEGPSGPRVKAPTVGKMALGIRVADIAGGGPIGHDRAFVRYPGRIVSALPLGLGYSWMLRGRVKQTWHDKFEVVVPSRSTPAG